MMAQVAMLIILVSWLIRPADGTSPAATGAAPLVVQHPIMELVRKGEGMKKSKKTANVEIPLSKLLA